MMGSIDASPCPLGKPASWRNGGQLHSFDWQDNTISLALWHCSCTHDLLQSEGESHGEQAFNARNKVPASGT